MSDSIKTILVITFLALAITFSADYGLRADCEEKNKILKSKTEYHTLNGCYIQTKYGKFKASDIWRFSDKIL